VEREGGEGRGRMEEMNLGYVVYIYGNVSMKPSVERWPKQCTHIGINKPKKKRQKRNPLFNYYILLIKMFFKNLLHILFFFNVTLPLLHKEMRSMSPSPWIFG
jgi:hypothetical protein